MPQLMFDPRSLADYETFLKLRRCPVYWFRGTTAHVPDEYASHLGMENVTDDIPVDLESHLYDYQRDIAAMAIRKRKYAVFADCGLGKTLIILEFARHAMIATGRKILVVSPLMVVRQTVKESEKWYPGLPVRRVMARDLPDWLESDVVEIGVTNYDAIRDVLPTSGLGGLILDESSMLKSHYGAWGTRLIQMGRGVEYKLCATGTPAPNDRIEYANHAVFLDRHRTVNEFLARYFVNRGQTQNRWELKPHALAPFYRDLSDWCVFLTNPATYGWQDNVDTTPPIHVHIEDVPLLPEQREAAQKLTGQLIGAKAGGIGQRGKLSQIAKGTGGLPTLKYERMRELIDQWPDESTIIWCNYNYEQSRCVSEFPDAVSISGSTNEEKRHERIDAFLAGDVRVMITKPSILGFGLNLQIATRQVFSGIKDSYEEYYQAVKRSNRIGSTKPLNVHIPVTELEVPFVDNVLRKADRVMQDTLEQERLFQELAYV